MIKLSGGAGVIAAVIVGSAAVLICLVVMSKAIAGVPAGGVADQFVQLLAQGKCTKAVELCDARMAEGLPAGQLAQVWQTLVEKNGSFKQFLPERRSESLGSFKAVFVPAVFAKHTLDLKVVTDANNRVSGFWIVEHVSAARPSYVYPAYVDQGKFTERPTKITCSGFSLDALWTMPAGSSPFPALILVHGSGPNDKDETIGPNKPFKDLSGGLASKGIAVLRYEKRTRQHPERCDDNITVQEETIDDVLAAVKLARSTMGIDPARVFVLGHSLGGTLAPRIGKQCPELAGLVVLAGATRPLEDLLLDQTEYLLSGKKDAGKQISELKEQIARVKDPSLSAATKKSLLPLNTPAKYWLDLRAYDPVAVAAAAGKPMLILQGGRDYQVRAEKDFRRWQDGLSSNKLCSLKLYPQLNHLFIEGTGLSKPEEYDRPGHVSRQVIDDIAQWIQDRQ